MFWLNTWTLRLAAGAALLAVLLGAAWAVLEQLERVRMRADQAGYERAQGEYSARALQATEQAREAERQAAARVARIEREAHERQIAQERAAAAAGDELERLRNALAALPASGRGGASTGTAAAGEQHGAPAAAAVAAQCAGRLLEVARAADTVTGQLLTLQDWVRTVPSACVASMAASQAVIK